MTTLTSLGSYTLFMVGTSLIALGIGLGQNTYTCPLVACSTQYCPPCHVGYTPVWWLIITGAATILLGLLNWDRSRPPTKCELKVLGGASRIALLNSAQRTQYNSSQRLDHPEYQ